MEINHFVHLTKFTGLSSANISVLRKKVEDIPYSNETGYGYKNIICEHNYLGATLVKRTPTFIHTLEPVTGQIIEQEIFLFSEIDFGLDYVYETLHVFGSNRNLLKVSTLIYPLLSNNIKIGSVNFSPSVVIPLLIKKNLLISVERLVVNNFQYKEGVSGRYDMRIDDTVVSQEIISHYGHDVTKANLLIEIPGIGRTKITIASNGSLLVRAEDTDLNDIVQFIKSVIEMKE